MIEEISSGIGHIEAVSLSKLILDFDIQGDKENLVALSFTVKLNLD